jgi:chaperonin GroES
LYDRVLVRKAEAEAAIEVERADGTKTLLHKAETALPKTTEGVVLAVGEGRLLPDGRVYPLRVQVGDQVIFGIYAWAELVVDGEEVLVLREEEIVAVLA